MTGGHGDEAPLRDDARFAPHPGGLDQVVVAHVQPDGSRLYVGGQLPKPNANDMLVLDMTGPDPLVLSVTEQAPGHSIDFMTINGREYLLHSNEITATGCVLPRTCARRGWASQIAPTCSTSATRPHRSRRKRSAWPLRKFSPQCAPEGIGGPSTAYHDVDDPTDTTYAIIGFESAGYRIFDVRDPANPVEVAYFNHGRSQHTKSYVIPETGHIWASDANGFWVLELEPQVRDHLGLDDDARPGCGLPSQVPPPARPGKNCQLRQG